MGKDVLQSLQEKWGLIEFSDTGASPDAGAMPEEQAAAEPPPCPQPSITSNPDRDLARLKEIMRMHPIRPHLHEGGGTGFSYDLTWGYEHRELIKEFSLLWFTIAGDIFVAQYGHLMHVIPRADYSKTVQFRLWRHEASHAVVGSNAADNAAGDVDASAGR